MLAAADFFVAVQCANLERDTVADDLRYFGDGQDGSPDRRCREVMDVDVRANGALTGLEIRLDCVQRRVLHRHDHHGSCQHFG